MAFTSTTIHRGSAGDRRIVSGKGVSADSSTGGEVTTGLNRVESFQISQKGSSIITNAAVVNETFPLEKGDVTIVTTSNETVGWTAIGR